MRRLACVLAGLGLGVAASAAQSEPLTADRDPPEFHNIEKGEVGGDWKNLSGLTAHARNPYILYAVPDRDGGPPRVLEIDVRNDSPKIVREIRLTGCPRPLDLEGIVTTQSNQFWIVSEGGRGDTPPNRLLKVHHFKDSGNCERRIRLPDPVARHMTPRGLEGVALQEDPGQTAIYVPFQGPTDMDKPGHARIGKLDLRHGRWSYFYYPLEPGPTIGISELLYLGDGRFAAIERDNEKGEAAKVKWITTFELPPEGAPASATDIPVVKEKKKAVDLADIFKDAGREVPQQIEGLALTRSNELYVLNDAEAKDTVLLNLGDACAWGVEKTAACDQ